MQIVLDASAVLALYFREPGSELVVPVTAGSLISAVNYSEALSKAVDRGDGFEAAQQRLSALGMIVVPVDLALAMDAAALRPTTRRFGLSIGDRICLALAAREKAKAYTVDRVWAKLDLPVEIVVLR